MGNPLPTPSVLSPLLEAERFGLVTDFDGTIASIAVRPEGAAVSPVAREALATLAQRLPLVGAMSGRALFDLRDKLNLPELLYIGSHGLTWWYQGTDEMPEDVRPYVAKATKAMQELAALRALPGIRFEEKGIGLAIHYRRAPDHAAARQWILDAIAVSEAAQAFEIREGILVAELYPRITVNKGTAIRRVVERFALDGLLFLGDDLTDVDAMYAAESLRKDGAHRIATIAVRHAEAPPIAAEVADWYVDGVAGSEEVLEWLVEETADRRVFPAPGPSPTPWGGESSAASVERDDPEPAPDERAADLG